MKTKDSITVSAYSINTLPAALSENFNLIKKAYREASNKGGEIVVLPELALSGYGCEDLFLWPQFIDACHKQLKELAKITKSGAALFVGTATRHENGIYNAIFALADGKVMAGVAKEKLAGDGVHYEPRWFKAWCRDQVVRHQYFKVPFGDLLFKIRDIRIGVEICEDAWSVERRAARYVADGVDIILNPAASHYAFGKEKIRAGIALETSRALQVAYIQTNLLGCESGRLIYDGATVIAAGGESLVAGERLTLNQVSGISANINLRKLRAERGKIHAFPKAEKALSDIKLVELKVAGRKKISKIEKRIDKVEVRDKEISQSQELYSDFTNCYTLALFDYLRKSSAKGGVVSLSGGADSAAVSIGMALTYIRAASLKQTKRLFPDLKEHPSAQKLIGDRLVCIYQATLNSSHETKAAAKLLAEELRANFLNLNIQAQLEGYLKLIEKHAKVKLNWKKHDIALQNIQARTRAPAPWLVANINGFLMLTTSNRSEGAVGYFTMDGDSCGGLAPLAGLSKPFILGWLKWVAKAQPFGLDVACSLKLILETPPTAELKPKTAKQSDEGDLMPYRALDYIERALLIERYNYQEIVEKLCSLKLANTKSVAQGYLNKFLTLFARSQWKRERLAPSFHFDDHNLDPRSWLRFPILLGDLKRAGV
jgi:NAD+ synthase (glutamine-hydrolysing)